MMKFPLTISIFSFIIFGIIVSILSINFENHTVLARCPNGTHKSPSGDCEKVTNTKGIPRCPNGSHRSPDGDCEKVSGGDSSSSSKNNDNNKHSCNSQMTKAVLKVTITMTQVLLKAVLPKMIHLTQETQIL